MRQGGVRPQVGAVLPGPRRAGAGEGGWNWSKYCNEELDAAAQAADAMAKPEEAEARLQAWSAVFEGVMEDAPWAPVFNEQRFTMKSPRMGERRTPST